MLFVSANGYPDAPPELVISSNIGPGFKFSQFLGALSYTVLDRSEFPTKEIPVPKLVLKKKVPKKLTEKKAEKDILIYDREHDLSMVGEEHEHGHRCEKCGKLFKHRHIFLPKDQAMKVENLCHVHGYPGYGMFEGLTREGKKQLIVKEYPCPQGCDIVSKGFVKHVRHLFNSHMKKTSEKCAFCGCAISFMDKRPHMCWGFSKTRCVICESNCSDGSAYMLHLLSSHPRSSEHLSRQYIDESMAQAAQTRRLLGNAKTEGLFSLGLDEIAEPIGDAAKTFQTSVQEVSERAQKWFPDMSNFFGMTNEVVRDEVSGIRREMEKVASEISETSKQFRDVGDSINIASDKVKDIGDNVDGLIVSIKELVSQITSSLKGDENEHKFSAMEKQAMVKAILETKESGSCEPIFESMFSQILAMSYDNYPTITLGVLEVISFFFDSTHFIMQAIKNYKMMGMVDHAYKGAKLAWKTLAKSEGLFEDFPIPKAILVLI